MANLQEGLVDELKRNRKLLECYRELGPVGSFGAGVITQAIELGEAALKAGDVVEMIKAYEYLKNRT